MLPCRHYVGFLKQMISFQRETHKLEAFHLVDFDILPNDSQWKSNRNLKKKKETSTK